MNKEYKQHAKTHTTQKVLNEYGFDTFVGTKEVAKNASNLGKTITSSHRRVPWTLSIPSWLESWFK
jgi:siderophore synthetase component